MSQVEQCVVNLEGQPSTESGREFRRAVTIPGLMGREWVVSGTSTDENGSVSTQLYRGLQLEPWGPIFHGQPGPVLGLCHPPEDCGANGDGEQLGIITEGGRIGLLGSDGRLTNPSSNDMSIPALVRPSGLSLTTVTLSDAGGMIILINSNGRLMGIDPQRPQDPVRWSVSIGHPQRGGPFLRTVTIDEEKSRILVRDPRFGQNNISVFDAESGEMIGGSLGEEAIKSMRVAEFAAVNRA